MTTWANITKNVSAFVNQVRNTSSYANQSKTSYWSDLILLENGFFLLLETGGGIALEQSGVVYTPTYTNQTKS